MLLEDAIVTAEKLEAVQKLKREGAFVCSAYVLLNPKQEITSWNINYYNPQTKKITHVFVGDVAEVGETDDPMFDKNYEPFQKPLKISGQKALEIARKETERLVVDVTKIIISLQKDGGEVWSVSFIGKAGNVVNTKIDVETGELLFSEKSNLVQRTFKGS